MVVETCDFERCKAIPDHCKLCDHTQEIQGWVDNKIRCPLAVELVSHLHSPRLGRE